MTIPITSWSRTKIFENISAITCETYVIDGIVDDASDSPKQSAQQEISNGVAISSVSDAATPGSNIANDRSQNETL